MDWLVIGVFAFVYLGMILGRIPGLSLDRTGVALLGAIALLAGERVATGELWRAVDLPTLALLSGSMVVSAQFRLGGFYACWPPAGGRRPGSAGHFWLSGRRALRRCWQRHRLPGGDPGAGGALRPPPLDPRPSCWPGLRGQLAPPPPDRQPPNICSSARCWGLLAGYAAGRSASPAGVVSCALPGGAAGGRWRVALARRRCPTPRGLLAWQSAQGMGRAGGGGAAFCWAPCPGATALAAAGL